MICWGLWLGTFTTFWRMCTHRQAEEEFSRHPLSCKFEGGRECECEEEREIEGVWKKRELRRRKEKRNRNEGEGGGGKMIKERGRRERRGRERGERGEKKNR